MTLDSTPRLAWLLTLLVALAPGCETTTADDDDDDSSSMDDDDDDSGDDDDDDTQQQFNASMVVELDWPDGSPAVGVNATYCGPICFFLAADEQGRLEFSPNIEAPWVFDAIGESGPNGDFSTYLVPTYVEDGTSHDLGSITMPQCGARVDVDESGMADIGDDLTLLYDRTDLNEEEPDPTGTVPQVIPEWLAGARLPESNYPPQWGNLEGREVLDIWYFCPYEVHSESGEGIGFTTPNSYGLEAGASVDVFVAHYTEFDYVQQATATVSSDGSTIELTEQGLERLTWILLVTPE